MCTFCGDDFQSANPEGPEAQNAKNNQQFLTSQIPFNQTPQEQFYHQQILQDQIQPLSILQQNKDVDTEMAGSDQNGTNEFPADLHSCNTKSTSPTISLFKNLTTLPFSLRPRDAARGVLCFFWDLATTGVDPENDHITQIGCTCRRFHFGTQQEHAPTPSVLEERTVNSTLAGQGVWEPVYGYPNKEFTVYVSATRPMSAQVSKLTGFTNKSLAKCGFPLDVAFMLWQHWVLSIRQSYPDCPVWFVACDGNRFDIPLLLQQERTILKQDAGTFFKSVGVSGFVDTCVLSHVLVNRLLADAGSLSRLLMEDSSNLDKLYLKAFGRSSPRHHNALACAKSVADLLCQQPYLEAWQNDKVGWEVKL